VVKIFKKLRGFLKKLRGFLKKLRGFLKKFKFSEKGGSYFLRKTRGP